MATRIWPAQRTLQALRKRGIRTQKVEHWINIPNPKPGMPPGRRIDLFGFIDGIALDMKALAGFRIIGWQACARSSLSDHIAKITGPCYEAASDWLCTGARIQIWGWGKMKRQPRDLWLPLIVELVIDGHGAIIETYRGDLDEMIYAHHQRNPSIDDVEGGPMT